MGPKCEGMLRQSSTTGETLSLEREPTGPSSSMCWATRQVTGIQVHREDEGSR